MTVASDNVFPKIRTSEGTAWATPASGFGVIYEKTDGLLYFKNDAGTEYDLTGASSAANIVVFDEGVNKGTATAGINVVGTYASGTVTSGTAIFTFPLPPGHEYDYAQGTATVNVTGTTETGATTIVTGNAVTYDGTAIVNIEFYAPSVNTPSNAAGDGVRVWLFEDGVSIGRLGFLATPAAAVLSSPMHVGRRMTPSAGSHTYSVRAHVNTTTGTPSVVAQSGGTALYMPFYIRITKV